MNTAETRYIEGETQLMVSKLISQEKIIARYKKVSLLKELMELSRRADGETCEGECNDLNPCAECRARRAINEAAKIFQEALEEI